MIRRLIDALAFLRAFIRTRWGYRFRDRSALLAHQERQVAELLRRRAPQAPFYRARRGQPLHDLPIVSKQDMLRAFSRFNIHGIELEDAREAAFRAERERDFKPTLPGGITVGCSSGTSGQPGVFLISGRERSVWAGTILARMLSSVLLKRVLNPFAAPVRIAFFLRANSNLYTSVRGLRIRFEFFDLVAPMSTHAALLDRYAPDVLIAPASVLAHLGRLQRAGSIAVHPAQVISVAETLEADDTRWIQSAWHLKPQQIYQCTEGFLGYSCAHGSLHLNEEFVHFETQSLGDDRVAAVVTDFSRHTQLFVRFQMDDVLRPNTAPCACGRVTMRLTSIEGRQDDVLWLPTVDGRALHPVFPDQVRRALMLAIPQCEDYRLRQRGLSVEIALLGAGGGWAAARGRIRAEFAALCRNLNVREPALVQTAWTAGAALEKRRRIVCVSRPSEAPSEPLGAHASVGGAA